MISFCCRTSLVVVFRRNERLPLHHTVNFDPAHGDSAVSGAGVWDALWRGASSTVRVGQAGGGCFNDGSDPNDLNTMRVTDLRNMLHERDSMSMDPERL